MLRPASMRRDLRLTGTLFADYHICPRKAWYKLHGDKNQKSKDPPRLQELQKAGNDHEQKICQNHFPEGLEPEGERYEEMKEATLALMERESPMILQGVFTADDALGIPDLLESTGTSIRGKMQYRVGDIKYSEKVRSHHVLQISFYSMLLQATGYGKCEEGFVIDRFGRKIDIDLGLYREIYHRYLSQLRKLLHDPPPPKPSLYLTGLCRDCPWRGLCMDLIDKDKHISLLPQLSRTEVEKYWGAGKTSLRQIDPKELGLGKMSVDYILSGRYYLKEQFRPGIFSEGTPATVVKEDESVKVLLSAMEHPINPEELGKYLEGRPCFLYGRDYDLLKRYDQSAHLDLPLIDLYELISQDLHAPFPSLELKEAARFASQHWPDHLPEPAVEGDSRISLLETLLQWLDWLNSSQEGFASAE